MPRAYLTRSDLATELSIGESTVDDMVRKGVLPPPVRMSSGCVRWRWESVDRALLSLMGGASNDATPINVAERVSRALQAEKNGGRGRAA